MGNIRYKGENYTKATAPVLIDKNITENGTYNASNDGADGYKSVNVNVTGDYAITGAFTLSANGIYQASEIELIFPPEMRSTYNAFLAAVTSASFIKRVTMNEGLKTIGDQAFRDARFAEITIPSTVTSIGTQAFRNCYNLASITCKAVSPPSIKTDTFQNVDSTCPIYVPAQSVNAYKSASYWSARAAYIQAIPE